MLSIDRLRLQLPAGYQHRAADIARQLGEQLGGLDTTGLRSLSRLSVPAVHFDAGASDAELAASIATAIGRQLRRSR